MKIILVYLRIISRVEPSLPMIYDYSLGEERFLRTYKQFRPKMPHDLVVVNCGPHLGFIPWDASVTTYLCYDGSGSDCGTYQHVGRVIDCDLIVCFNTIAYFWRPGWLEPFARARSIHGPGVFGPTASYENNPHLRTPCIAFDPRLMREYPRECTTRLAAGLFESGPENFSLWAHNKGYPSLLVLEHGERRIDEWRKDPNIFRRGDQSNCLVWDRHTEIWEKASPHDRENLSRYADIRGR